MILHTLQVGIQMNSFFDDTLIIAGENVFYLYAQSVSTIPVCSLKVAIHLKFERVSQTYT